MIPATHIEVLSKGIKMKNIGNFKRLRIGVSLMALFPLLAAAGSISLNFTPAGNIGDLEAGTNYGLAPADGSAWTQITAVSGGGEANLNELWSAPVILKDAKGVITTATIETDARALERGNGTNYDGLLRGYFLDYWVGARWEQQSWPRIKLSNIPYARYRIYVYMCNASIVKNASLTITPEGGEQSLYYYMSGATLKTAATPTAWGDKAVTAPTLGSNCLLTPILSEPTITIKLHRVAGESRASVAAMQIVEMDEPTLTLSSDATINPVDYTPCSALTIVNNGTGNTLTLNGAISLSSLNVSGNPLIIKQSAPLSIENTVEINTAITFVPAITSSVWPQRHLLINAPAVTLGASGSVQFAPSREGFIVSQEGSLGAGLSAIVRSALPEPGSARTVSVNFASDISSLAGETGMVGAYPVDASLWINCNQYGNTGANPTQTVLSALADNLGNTNETSSLQVASRGGGYYSGTKNTLIGKLMYGYLDDSNNGSNYAGFKVTNVPYDSYAVVIYFNNAGGQANPFIAYRVNGSYYRGDAALGGTLPASGATAYWGSKSTTALTEGGNYLVIGGFSKERTPDLLVSIDNWGSGGYRGCISGFQLIETDSTIPAETFSATVSGDATLSQIAWDDGKAWIGGSPNTSATITFEGDATLTLDGVVSLKSFTLISSGRLLIKNAATPLSVYNWDLGGVAALELDGQGSTLLPSPMAAIPKKYFYTAPSATLNVASGEVYEMHAGSAESPAVYTASYAGGALEISGGNYRMTAPPTNTRTALDISGNPVVRFHNGTAEQTFGIGKMNAVISGGTIYASKFVTTEGADFRTNTVDITGGDIIISGTGAASATSTAALMFGHWSAGNSVVTLSGGSIRADQGGFRISNDSPVDFTVSGTGYLRVKGIGGKGTQPTAFTVADGGEVAIGVNGFTSLANLTFTLAGGALTSFENNTISMAITAREGTVSTISAAAGVTATLNAIQGGGSLILGTAANTGTLKLASALPAFTGTLTLNGAIDFGTCRPTAATLDPASAGLVNLKITAAEIKAAKVPLIGWNGAEPPENVTFAIYGTDGALLPTARVKVDPASRSLCLAINETVWNGTLDPASLSATSNLALGDAATADSLLNFQWLLVPPSGATVTCLPGASIRPAAGTVFDGPLTLDATALSACAGYTAFGMPYTACLLYGTIGNTDLVTVIPPEVPTGYTATVEVFADGVYLTLASPIIENPSLCVNFTANAMTGVKDKEPPYFGALSNPAARYGVFPVLGSEWFEVFVANTNLPFTVEIAPGLSVSGENHRGAYGGTTFPADYLKGYIDDNSAVSSPTVAITGLEEAFGAGAKYRVIVYSSTNYNGAKFGYMTIGGVNYSIAHSHTVGARDDNWGSPQAALLAEGNYHLVSDVLTGDAVTVTAHSKSTNVRGTIAAIQVVQVFDEAKAVPFFKAAEVADGSWTALPWVNISENDEPYTGDWIEPGAVVWIDASNGDPVTLTVEAPVEISKLIVTGSGEVTLTLGDAGSFSAIDYDFAAHTGKFTVGFATGAANVAVGTHTRLVGGSGSLTIAADKMASIPTFGAWSGYMVKNGILRYHNSIAVTNSIPAQTGTVAFNSLSFVGSGTNGLAVPTLLMEEGDEVTLVNNSTSAATRFDSNAVITGGTLTIDANKNPAAFWNGNRTITQTGGSVVHLGTGTMTGTANATGFVVGTGSGYTTWNMSGGTIHSPNAPLHFWANGGAITLSGTARATFTGVICEGGGDRQYTRLIVKDGATLALGARGITRTAIMTQFHVSDASLTASASTGIAHAMTVGGVANLSAAAGQTLTFTGALSGAGGMAVTGGTLALGGEVSVAGEVAVETGATLRAASAAINPESGVRVKNGATLTGSGTIGTGLAFEDGAVLLKPSADPLDALTLTGSLTLPETGALRVASIGGLANSVKYYILKGAGTQDADLDRIAPADEARVGKDETGIFLRRRIGILISIY